MNCSLINLPQRQQSPEVAGPIFLAQLPVVEEFTSVFSAAGSATATVLAKHIMMDCKFQNK